MRDRFLEIGMEPVRSASQAAYAYTSKAFEAPYAVLGGVRSRCDRDSCALKKTAALTKSAEVATALTEHAV